MSTGGSLPDLSNLQFSSPLSTPLDPEDNGGYPNLSGGSSTGNLPAAMMHLGISNSQGEWKTPPASDLLKRTVLLGLLLFLVVMETLTGLEAIV